MDKKVYLQELADKLQGVSDLIDSVRLQKLIDWAMGMNSGMSFQDRVNTVKEAQRYLTVKSKVQNELHSNSWQNAMSYYGRQDKAGVAHMDAIIESIQDVTVAALRSSLGYIRLMNIAKEKGFN